MDTSEIQVTQAEYDRENSSHRPGNETICHTERHITKLAGKIATVAEMVDHGEQPDLIQLDTEVIPDLLIYAARLANDRGIDLGEAFTKRTMELRLRFSETHHP